MKKMLKFALATTLAFLPLAAMAQQTTETNIASFSFGGPSTYITVTNDTNDGSTLILNVAGKQSVQSEKAGRYRVRIGAFSQYQGDVPIFITACSDIRKWFSFQAPRTGLPTSGISRNVAP